MNIKNILSTNIISLRKIKGITQHKLAAAAGISKMSEINIEHGKVENFGAITLSKLSVALNTPVFVLISGKEFYKLLHSQKEDLQPYEFLSVGRFRDLNAISELTTDDYSISKLKASYAIKIFKAASLINEQSRNTPDMKINATMAALGGIHYGQIGAAIGAGLDSW